MPTIPLIQDSATLETATGRQRIGDDANAFGAQEARGLAALGQGLGGVAEVAAEKDDEFAEAEALEADNELSRGIRERLHGVENGYLTTQRGRAAIDGRLQVEADVDEMAVAIGERISNPRARAMYDRVARRRVGDTLGSIASYAAQQTREFNNQQSESRVQEAVDNAVAAYGDPASVNANVSIAMGEIERLARREGWSEDTTRNRIRQLRSDITRRVIVQLAETDPTQAEAMYETVRPQLSAQEAGELLTTMRMARREREDGLIDEAWSFVAAGREIPGELWSSLPGRAQIDIQNERRRRAEGGSGGGDRTLIEDLRVMAVADPEQFARADLRAVRGALGSSYDELAIAQANIRNGREGADINQQRTTYSSLLATAEAALGSTGVDLAEDSDQGRAFRANLLRELQAYQAAGGTTPNGDEAQIIIGRAWVSMRGSDVERTQGRVRGDRGRTSRSAVIAGTEVNVPYALIPPATALRIGTRLQERLGRQPTQGEVENAYASMITGRPLEIGGE